MTDVAFILPENKLKFYNFYLSDVTRRKQASNLSAAQKLKRARSRIRGNAVNMLHPQILPKVKPEGKERDTNLT
jgi:hypothetical protein